MDKISADDFLRGIGGAADIKAIETTYKGYRFRSRLEARWAVFFDELGIKYEYEPEGFDLEKVGRYLPDFWLPDLGWWVEIKPKYPEQSEIDKCIALSNYGGGEWRVMLIAGNPWPSEYKVLVSLPIFVWPEMWQDGLLAFSGQFGECKDCGRWWLWDNEGGAQYVRLGKHIADCWWTNHDASEWKSSPVMNVGRVFDGYREARSARFEHGEKG